MSQRHSATEPQSLRSSPLSRQSTSASESVTTMPKAVRGLTTPGWHVGGGGDGSSAIAPLASRELAAPWLDEATTRSVWKREEGGT